MFDHLSLERLKAGHNTLIALFFIAVFILFTFATRTYYGHLDLKIALGGFSVVDFTNTILHSDNFVNDYPGGAKTIGKSLLVWIYPFFETYFGVPAYKTLWIVIFLQIGFLVISGSVLLHALLGHTHPSTYVLFTVLLLTGSVLHFDLARFGDLIYGQYYSFVNGLRLLAIVAILNRQWTGAAALLSLAFTFHPAMTIATLPVIAAFFLLDGQQTKKLLPWSMGALTAIFCVAWSLIFVFTDINYPVMSSEDFFKYSRILNYHWFLSDLRAYVQDPNLVILPFLAALLVGLEALRQSGIEKSLKLKLYFSIFAILAVSLLGLANSIAEWSPSVTKLSPQRASALAALLVLPFFVQRFLEDINLLRVGSLLIAFAVLYELLNTGTIPIVAALAYVLPTLTSMFRREKIDIGSILVAFVTLAAIISVGLQWKAGFFNINHYTVGTISTICLVFGVILLQFPAVMSFLNGTFRSDRSAVTNIIAWVTVVALSFVGMSRQHDLYTLTDKQTAKDYLAAQLWAANNTKKTALFMPDPCLAYGWRDFSQRSSWGTYNEFLKTAWLYSSNAHLLEEGLRRTKRLGINVDELLKQYPHDLSSRSRILCQTARATYYSADRTWFSNLAKDYGIDYFIFFKSELNGRRLYEPKYENDTLIILEAMTINDP